MSDFLFELNSEVKDKVTGYKGVIVARTEWLYGCRRYTVQSQEMKDGKPVDAMGFDEAALEVIVAAKKHVMQKTGGDAPAVTRGREVTR